MQKELQDLQPVLEETAVEVEAMMVQIEADKAAAAVTKAQVQEQEAAANEKAAAAKAIADDAQVCPAFALDHLEQDPVFIPVALICTVLCGPRRHTCRKSGTSRKCVSTLHIHTTEGFGLSSPGNRVSGSKARMTPSPALLERIEMSFLQ